MNWTTIKGSGPSSIHYEARLKGGTQLRIDPLWVNDWPAFRWSVHRSVAGQQFHHEEIAVDLEAAKHLAENFTVRSLAEDRED